jgi:hypothetical protein
MCAPSRNVSVSFPANAFFLLRSVGAWACDTCRRVRVCMYMTWIAPSHRLFVSRCEALQGVLTRLGWINARWNASFLVLTGSTTIPKLKTVRETPEDIVSYGESLGGAAGAGATGPPGAGMSISRTRTPLPPIAIAKSTEWSLCIKSCTCVDTHAYTHTCIYILRHTCIQTHMHEYILARYKCMQIMHGPVLFLDFQKGNVARYGTRSEARCHAAPRSTQGVGKQRDESLILSCCSFLKTRWTSWPARASRAGPGWKSPTSESRARLGSACCCQPRRGASSSRP